MADQEQTREDYNREKQEFWTSHIESWKESGLKQIEYCRQNNLSRHRFTYWKCKLNKKLEPLRFVAISGDGIRSQIYENNRAFLKLNIGDTYQIEFSDGFSPDTLSPLIRALGRI
jgi:hypothetical protein